MAHNLHSHPKSSVRPDNIRFSVVLVMIILTGGILRIYGAGWGLPYTYNSDEKKFVDTAIKLISEKTLDLRGFGYYNYGWPTFPVYFLTSIFALISLFVSPHHSEYYYLTARIISALFGTISILLIYVLGRRIYGRAVGLIAASFLAFTVMHIQLSHFYTYNNQFLFFVTLTLMFCYKIKEGGRKKDYLCAGIFGGLAFATHFTGFLAVFIILVSHYQYQISKEKTRISRIYKNVVGPIILLLILPTLLDPYSLFLPNKNPKTFLESYKLMSGRYRPQYAIQWDDSTPYAYHLKHLLFWGMGLPLQVITLLGTVYVLIKPRREDYILLTWFIIYFASIGWWQLKFMRYMLIVLPSTLLFGSKLIFDLGNKFGKEILYLVLIMCIVPSMFYSAAFMNIYSTLDSRNTALHWIEEHIPPDSTVLIADDGFYSSPQINPEKYIIKKIDFNYLHYSNGFDTSMLGRRGSDEQLTQKEKARYLSNMTADVDYIIFSDRDYPTYLRLSDEYPLESRYFASIFSGESGFTLIKEFKTYPEFLGMRINDDSAEASFRMMDHPKILIFKKYG